MRKLHLLLRGIKVTNTPTLMTCSLVVSRHYIVALSDLKEQVKVLQIITVGSKLLNIFSKREISTNP
jgi:hypothetical protein